MVLLGILLLICFCLGFFVFLPLGAISKNKLVKMHGMTKVDFFRKNFIKNYTILFINHFPKNKEYRKWLIRYRVAFVGILIVAILCFLSFYMMFRNIGLI